MDRDQCYALEDRYLADQGTVFLTGIQALARLPLEQLRADRRAGLNTAAFASGYPGSPLGGYDRAIASAAKLVPEFSVVCRPAMNEEYGASAVMGSQLAAAQPDCRYDGILGIWYGKAPGVDRASDALRHAVYAGASPRGGAVAIVGDDPAAKSSTVPSSSAGLLGDMHVPLLYPGDPAEALFLGRHAIALSRLTGLWTALKIVADVADATATVQLDSIAFDPILPLVDGKMYQHSPSGNLLTPRTIDVEREIYEVRYPLAREYAARNGLNRVTVNPTEAWVGIVSSGITYREIREAFARLGLRSDESIRACGIRLLNMGMPMPFDPRTVRQFAKGLGEVFVIEEKRPNLESLIKDALYDVTDRPRIVGKQDELGEGLVPGHGALDADILTPLLRARFADRLGDRIRPARPEETLTIRPLEVARTPFYCSGCPHNRSTQAPEGALVGAGIGCHTMALLMDEQRVGNIGGLGCMGNEGIQWIGMSDFLERDHFFQNLGDGTYFHSGQLAVQASVAAGVNVTYKLLYNGTVAMTGGQDPEGQLSVPAVATSLLNAGVSRVLITTNDLSAYWEVELPKSVEVWGRERLLEAQETLARISGTTVLIHDQGCAAELRRARKRGKIPKPRTQVVINHRICEGCGDCGQVSNCLSVQPVETPFGRKTEIDQTTCNFDYSCLEGDCPSFMTVTSPQPTSVSADAALAKKPPVEAGFEAGASTVRSSPLSFPRPPSSLPHPQLIVPDEDFAMRITGIGGTGVVTVAQVVGTAAMLDGYQVRGLDQIGLSQKAGPVVSDLRFSRTAPTATNRLGRGQADLLLAFDQLVAASERGLRTTAPERTAVVGSSSTTPTGEMITHLDVRLPSVNSLAERIAETTRADAQHWADAASITEELFGSATTANLFVVGMAVQSGCLPVSPAQIDAAIGLNGVAVAANQAAFAWGRAQIACPDRLESARKALRPSSVQTQKTTTHEESRLGTSSSQVLSAELIERVARLAGEDARRTEWTRYAEELVRWGAETDARFFLDQVEKACAAESRIEHSQGALSARVASSLFKLMAYKDEYEVARLMTDDDALSAVREVAGEGTRVAWKLHPPFLRAMGMNQKITIGVWATPLVRMLARAKRLRGTAFDLFGRAEVRRAERAMPAEFCAVLGRVYESLDTSNFEAILALAELPDQVRGYEDLKIRRIESYRLALAAAESEICNR